jgi:hypothetical protein
MKSYEQHWQELLALSENAQREGRCIVTATQPRDPSKVLRRDIRHCGPCLIDYVQKVGE